MLLLLSRAPEGEGTDLAEEARILYVGATRTRRDLRTAWFAPGSLYTVGDPKRCWRPAREFLVIEIGLEGDLCSPGEFPVEDPRALTLAVREAARIEAAAEARRGSDGGYRIYAASGGPALARLSEAFPAAARALRGAEDPEPDKVTHFRIVGASTRVVPGKRGEAPSLALVPVLGGFARAARRDFQ